MERKASCGMKKGEKRMYGLDLLRIAAMVVIFIGHSANQLGCNYYWFAPLIQLRDVAMTLFFMLSGFVLYYNYSKKDLSCFGNIKEFWIKRVAAIVPTYWFVAAGFIIFIGTDSCDTIIRLLPIEALGLQSTLTSIFSISHNGGTWFVSCLLLSYFFYPFMQELIKNISYKSKVSVTVILAALLTYIPFLIGWFNLVDIYDDPFYRGIEFVWGSCLAALILGWNQQKFCNVSRIKNYGGTALLLVSILITLLLLYNNIMVDLGPYSLGMYEVLRYPLLGAMTVGAALMDLDFLSGNKILNSLVKYLSSIAYEFFLAQFFTWKTSIFIFSILSVEKNSFRVLISFAICLIYATVIHYLFTRPISNFIKKKLIK